MTKIAKFFSTNFNKGDLYLIRISSLQSNLILVNYLTKYSIFSSKYLDYLDWKTIGQLKELGLHYLPEGINIPLCYAVTKV